MPIYEFACPSCRKIYSFLSKRVNPAHLPTCPKCGSKKLSRQVSNFAMIRGASEQASGAEETAPDIDIDERKLDGVMADLEKDFEHMDENNPRHMAHVLNKMKAALPGGTMPREFETAIKRLEKGESIEKIEEDMGDIFSGMMGEEKGGGGFGGGGGYSRDAGLYDY